jgi:hypothetical protein
MRNGCRLLTADAVADENEHFSDISWRSPALRSTSARDPRSLRKEHPEWIEPNGECPVCEAYESRLAKLLGLSSASEHRFAA